jgi:hypothetical protein
MQLYFNYLHLVKSRISPYIYIYIYTHTHIIYIHIHIQVLMVYFTNKTLTLV